MANYTRYPKAREVCVGGPNMSEREFFLYGTPGIDDEAKFATIKPEEISIGDDRPIVYLDYNINNREYKKPRKIYVYGYLSASFFGKKVELIPDERKLRERIDSKLTGILSQKEGQPVKAKILFVPKVKVRLRDVLKREPLF